MAALQFEDSGSLMSELCLSYYTALEHDWAPCTNETPNKTVSHLVCGHKYKVLVYPYCRIF